MKRGRILPLFLILFALMLPSGIPISDSVNAASTCTLTGQTTPDWGVDAELIETGSNNNFEEDVFFGQSGFSVGGNLDPLTNGFVTSVNVSDRAYTAIRMNMVEGYRYTFCVSFATAPNQTVTGDPLADVYLMENLDYDRYKWDDAFDEEMEQIPHFFHSLDGFLIEIYMHMKILGTLIFLLPLKTVKFILTRNFWIRK